MRKVCHNLFLRWMLDSIVWFPALFWVSHVVAVEVVVVVTAAVVEVATGYGGARGSRAMLSYLPECLYTRDGEEQVST